MYGDTLNNERQTTYRALSLSYLIDLCAHIVIASSSVSEVPFETRERVASYVNRTVNVYLAVYSLGARNMELTMCNRIY
jgi:hypothetical protein